MSYRRQPGASQPASGNRATSLGPGQNDELWPSRLRGRLARDESMGARIVPSGAECGGRRSRALGLRNREKTFPTRHGITWQYDHCPSTGHSLGRTSRKALKDLDSRQAVLRAVAEYDKLGRVGFLRTYGFGTADESVLHKGGIRILDLGLPNWGPHASFIRTDFA